ncbi:hypothetical protein XFLAVUS301_44470 [Xanthobacter flavus]|uniref:Uncharacterized protein n=1 Tax=Xanthobacter flavus TaxID=281 RepID=A0A9W6CVS1_XANFL|nr:hypothetical protein XFLAVUS301_44470 [Xanthobacter flavus]
MPDNLTRQDVYDLVWSSPRAEAAERLGLSELQLRQVCGFHRIPMPNSQYWRRVEKGPSPDNTALPWNDRPWLETIVGVPMPADWPAKLPAYRIFQHPLDGVPGRYRSSAPVGPIGRQPEPPRLRLPRGGGSAPSAHRRWAPHRA